MQPVIDPFEVARKKKRIIRLALLVTLGVVLLSMLSGLGLWFWQANSPQTKFNEFLANQTTPNYVDKNITIGQTKANGGVTLRVQSKSDLSNPKQPITELSYRASSDSKDVGGAEVVYLNENNMYGKITVSNETTRQLGLSNEAWYRPNFSSKTFFKIFDMYDMTQQLNTPVGLFEVHGDDPRNAELIKILSDSGSINVKSMETTGSTDVFTLTLVGDKVSESYVKYAKDKGLDVVSKNRLLAISAVSGNIKLFVNHDKNTVIKMEYESTIGLSNTKLQTTIEYSYPDKQIIKAPDNPKILEDPRKG